MISAKRRIVASLQGSGMAPSSLARCRSSALIREISRCPRCVFAGRCFGFGMKEIVLETPLIGSGSQEEADKRVQILLDLGTTRGYLTYEELNERLPDEVVSPDKLDSLLMKIDEMGIKLIDDMDVADF